MTEHRIRLRGAWDLRVGLEEDESQEFRRVDLPTVWTSDAATRFRLHRRFGRPPVDLGRETVRLELADVPGLVAIWINGREQVIRESVPLDGPLLPRNVVVLEVDLGGIDTETRARAWGMIALVIAPRAV